MHRSDPRPKSLLAALSIALLAGPVAAQPAAPASEPERFDLSGEGRTGTLVLSRSQGGFQATIELAGGEEGALRLGGHLSPAGAELQGRLSARLGLSGRLAPTEWLAPAYEASFARGDLVGSLRLERGVLRTPRGLRPIEGVERRSLALRATAPLGARSEANEAVIRRFYQAFVRSDAAGMAAEYAPAIRFSDPVFPDLRGEQAGGMWAMLCQSKPRIELSGVRAGERYGVARWDAYYQLIPGHPVHNVIEARFELRAGKIVRHVDAFDFGRWARQALGPARYLPEGFLLRVVRFASARQLSAFLAERRGAR